MFQKNYYKRALCIVLLTGVGVGLLLCAIQFAFEIPEKLIWHYYLRLAPLAILLCLIVNIIWQVLFFRRIRALNRTFLQDGAVDFYIEENRKLLARVRHPYNRSLLLVNLAVGYSDRKEFHQALETLRGVSERHLKGKNRVVYFNNLAYFYFRLGQADNAIAILDAHEDEFRAFENDAFLGKHIALNRVYRLLAAGGKVEAKEILDRLQQESTDKRLQTDLADLQQSFCEAPLSNGEER